MTGNTQEVAQLKGNSVIVRDTRGIVADFIRALNEATEVKMA
jgi:hypothetical protein